MSIKKILFDKIKNNKDVHSVILENSKGTKVEILTYGATLRAIGVFGKDVLLGHQNISQYEKIDSYIGATIGRISNRIAKGQFTLNGKVYKLAQNDGENHLHGGISGYNDKVWEFHSSDDSNNSVTLYHFDKGLEENYPANVEVYITFTLTEENELSINYKAKPDGDTFINLTNHSYFNLNGYESGDILNHILQINADCYTPSTPVLIPSGDIKSVENTPFDFRKPKTISKDFGTDGYDTNFVLNSSELKNPAVTAYGDKSNIKMTVYTDMPGVQLYTGNFLNGTENGKDGNPIMKHTGFCLETQYFPDTPNHDNFPSCLIKKGEEYNHTTIFKFEKEV